MHEDVDVAGLSVAEIHPGESRATTEMAWDARLEGTHQIEGEIRDDPPVEPLIHRLHQAVARAAIAASGARATRPTSLVNGRGKG